MVQQIFDVCYETTSIEGWPLLVIEVWDRVLEEERQFCGCGAITLPTSPGKHVLDCVTWRPAVTWWASVTGTIVNSTTVNLPVISDCSVGWPDYFLNYTWEYKRAQVLTTLLNPSERPLTRTVTSGVVRLEVYVVTAGFEAGGALMCGMGH